MSEPQPRHCHQMNHELCHCPHAASKFQVSEGLFQTGFRSCMIEVRKQEVSELEQREDIVGPNHSGRKSTAAGGGNELF